MKTRLTQISPGDSAQFLGFIGFVFSLPVVLFALAMIGPGKTVTLNGFTSFTFTNTIEPFWLLFAYPFLNALGGIITGFIFAWIYNFYARHFGGIAIEIESIEPAPINPAPLDPALFPSQVCARCGYTIPTGILQCPNCRWKRR